MGIAKTYVGVDRAIANMGPEVCIDFETNSTDVYHPDFKVTGVALYDGRTSLYIPTLVAQEGVTARTSIRSDMWTPTKFNNRWQKPLRKLLQQTDVLIAHNLVFELSILRRFGLYPIKSPITLLDTMGMAHLFNEAIPLSLKKLSYIILNRDQDEFSWSHFSNIETAAHYAIQDVVNDFDLCQWLWQYLDRNHMLGLYADQFYWLPILVEDMENTGVHLDTELMQADKKYMLGIASNLEVEICSMVGTVTVKRTRQGESITEEIPFANPNSTVELAAALKELGMKWKKDEVTATGKPATSKALLKQKSKEYKDKPVGDFLTKVLNYRKVVKYAQFIDNVASKAHVGVIHPSWNPYGTTTDRFSCSNPNFQQMPKHLDVEGREINPRKWFVAPEGHTMVVADLSQAELRVLAGRSGDSGMIAGYNAGVDGHTNTSALIYDTDPSQVSDSQRQVGKTANFALVYGSGPKLMADTLGIPVTEAKRIRKKLQQSMPDANRWIREQHRAVEYWGEVEIEGGRWRRPAYRNIRDLLWYDPEELMPGEERAEWFALENELNKDQKRRLSINIIRDMDEDRRRKVFSELEYRAKLQGANAAIQGQVARHLDLALIKLYHNEILLDYNVIGQVHDEVIVVCPDAQVGEVTQWVTECMEGYIGEVKLVSDAETGKSWGEAK